MSQQTMRGMRLGAQSLENERGVHYSARNKHIYLCPNGHSSEMVFSADAEVPSAWQCKHCSAEAKLTVDGVVVEAHDTENKVPRTHWEMLLERRTREELEEILQERLDYIRGRRARGQADL
jgi:hypothetical protein